MAKITDISTVKEAKVFLRENFDKGCECPTCGQFVKLYKRKLNSGMAVALIKIYKHNQTNRVNVKDFFRQHSMKNNHDWTLLRYWGLLKEITTEEIPSNKKSNGLWKITTKGEMFLKGEITELSHILIYNNSFQGYSGDRITIKDALGSKFNYEELMNS